MKQIMAAAALLAAAASCGGGRADKANPEADSLQAVVNGKTAEMDEMNLFLDAVNVSMDSVVNMEGIILRRNGESPLSRKEQIRRNLAAYKQVLRQQHERIAELERRLDAGDPRAAKMLRTISALKRQLEEKDKAIAQLSQELGRRDFDIQNLKKDITKLNDNVAQLEQTSTKQQQTIDAQAEQMNEAYVLIGSKSELKAAGVLTGGSLFKKSKLDMSQTGNAAFRKIDIRKVHTLQIPGKNPKMLTQAPAGSYTITPNSDGTSTLSITQPEKFWSVSSYLVIRY